MSHWDGVSERRAENQLIQITLAEIKRDIDYIKKYIESNSLEVMTCRETFGKMLRSIDRNTVLVNILWLVFGIVVIGSSATSWIKSSGVVEAVIK